MDQAKIGKFIADCRKERGLTQAQLAEKVGVSDRAVSKWETGRSMPDAAIMLEVCEAIGINVNELLNGERIVMDEYKDKAEAQLMEMKRQDEERVKSMLHIEIVLGVISVIAFFTLLFTAVFAVTGTPWRIGIIVLGAAVFLFGIHTCLRIEQEAGYYECRICGYRYVPKLSAVYLAPHIGRARKMRCPNCGRKSYQKKVLTKE